MGCSNLRRGLSMVMVPYCSLSKPVESVFNTMALSRHSPVPVTSQRACIGVKWPSPQYRQRQVPLSGMKLSAWPSRCSTKSPVCCSCARRMACRRPSMPCVEIFTPASGQRTSSIFSASITRPRERSNAPGWNASTGVTSGPLR